MKDFFGRLRDYVLRWGFHPAWYNKSDILPKTEQDAVILFLAEEVERLSKEVDVLKNAE